MESTKGIARFVGKRGGEVAPERWGFREFLGFGDYFSTAVAACFISSLTVTNF
jgi:hypothetical protein